MPVNCETTDVTTLISELVSVWPAATTPEATAVTVSTLPEIDPVTTLVAIDAELELLTAMLPVTTAPVGGLPVAANVTAPVA